MVGFFTMTNGRLAYGACTLACTLVMASCGVARPALAQPGFDLGERTVPTQALDIALTTLASGDFQQALQIASREYQGAIQLGGQRWIDSIAAAALVGECQYELGSLREAVAAYEDAMRLATVHGDWLLAVQFPSQRLRARSQARVATWGRTVRKSLPASLPETVSIRQGSNPENVLKKGGVLAAPVNFPIRPEPIMRAIVVSIYRYGSILGDIAGESSLLTDLRQVLGKRPAPPNHYSQSWVDVALGMACWAQGRSDEAFGRFKAGLLVENQFDHPLTCWALIGMGRIALDAGRDAEAAAFFEEASYTAADFGDARALEEAFSGAATAHLAAGTRGVPATIVGGAAWARGNLPVLHARLLAAQAECLAVAGDPQAAARILSGIDTRVLRGDPGRGLCGADVAYASATVAYRGGDGVGGDRELFRSIGIMQPRGVRLFQLAKLVELVRAGTSVISDRRADELFRELLEDPLPRWFTIDPVGTLAMLTAPRQEAFEIWGAIAARRGLEEAKAVVEATARARWLESQPLGGRRAAIEALIGCQPEALSVAEAERRAAILARYPSLAVAIDSMTRAGDALRGAAGDAQRAAPDGFAADAPEWDDYRQAATARAGIVATLAGSREPTAFPFPPLLSPAEIRGRLRPGEVILSFHWTSTGLTGILEAADGKAAWDVKQPGTLVREIAGLLKALCLFDAAAPVPTERLVTTDWRVAAERVERLLFKDARINLADDAVKELVIVPDGALWYVPFEILPAGSGRQPLQPGDEPRRLRDTCLIRYCPTRSLAVDRFAAGGDRGLVGVHLGRMHKGDTLEAAGDLGERLSLSLDRPLLLGGSSGAPLLSAASLVDTMLIFDEVPGDGSVAARPLAVGWPGRSGMTFGEWVASPRKRPQTVLLPGFQSAAASGLARVPARPGDDLFLAATDLLAAGGRTAVVSRWRMGGRSTVHLMEEFVADYRHRAGAGAAADSWHRAVDIVSAEEPDIDREPRLTQSPGAVLTDSRHPLFWAGCMLVDCGNGDRSDPAPPGPAGRPAPRPPVAAPAPQAAPAPRAGQ
jgi:tetratricopeptide (TPR) repeat protein